jgi:hypothetical protein
VGWNRVLQRIREFGRNPHGDPGFWAPAPLLERLAAGAGPAFGDHLTARAE